jgi:septal ring factor EnvC (AmiA/AmiB activator)
MSTFEGNSSFRDRRSNQDSAALGRERRQFADSHDSLSPDAAELGRAIDEYKLQHRRRFISYEEILGVVTGLGYSKSPVETATT